MSDNGIRNDHASTNYQKRTSIVSDHSVSSLDESFGKTINTKSVLSTETPVSEVILAEKEAKDIQRVRILIILVLLMSAVGATAVYLYSMHLENEQFEHQFEYDGNKVFASLGTSLEKALGGLDTLASTISSIASHTNQTFPFVTITDFPVHVSRSISSTNALITFLAPIVTFDQRPDWERYMSRNFSKTSKNEVSLLEQYVGNALQFQEGWKHYYGPTQDPVNWTAADSIYGDFGDTPYYNQSEYGPGIPDIYVPEWHMFPLIMGGYSPAGYDWFESDERIGIINLIEKQIPVLSRPYMIPRPDNPLAVQEAMMWCPHYEKYLPPGSNCMEPIAEWYYPVIESYDKIDISDESISSATNTASRSKNAVKAMLVTTFYWRELLRDILPDNSKGMILVTENSCLADASFTYQINGPNVKYIGVGDYHQPKYNRLLMNSSLFNLNSYRQGESDYYGFPIDEEECVYSFAVYPSDEMKQEFQTSQGIIFAVTAACFVLFPFLVFILYDRKVSKQQKVLMTSANQSNAIIDSLFPSNIRDKLYPIGIDGNGLLNGNCDTSDVIADLYPETTVLFADIADFTVWSSVRDPFQVFTLLESLFGVYDRLAERRKIFKVETVGDSYIAVCGLPTPNKNHAIVMAKFAKEIQIETRRTVMKLEKRLGPGTGDLRVRVGLNSGPTTAGVLRGAKGRFQLFGDTVNTAARMESNSAPSKIMCSEKTANLLVAAGKEHWISRRDALVSVKGKGLLVCYWVNPKTGLDNSVPIDVLENQSLATDAEEPTGDKLSVDCIQHRFVDWMAEMFGEMLRDIVVSRDFVLQDPNGTINSNDIAFLTPREEVTEAIALPARSSSSNNIVIVKLTEGTRDPIVSQVKSQIQEYISMISQLYQPNPFHNFEHACHVVLVAKKLLARVVKHDDTSTSATSYGITSDPLTQFAIIFSALIHDVDHPGVSNAQLVKEKNPIAIMYQDQSVAEQNSVTIAWDLLMQPRFTDFRNTIMSNEIECRQFRQLLVNSVMATDLFDKYLKELRDNRWNIAFNDTSSSSSPSDGLNKLSPSTIALSEQDSNRRATIVIEHVIQAADVSHTMQHWHVYQKWNKKLLHEMYLAFINGRSEKDPSLGWYDGELWFFDNYIIPLAKKLKTCGVFGVSCDELLDYAMENRAEWAAKGKQIVEENLLDLKDLVNKSTCSKANSNMETTDEPVRSMSKYIGSEFDDVLDTPSFHSSVVDITL